MKRFVFMVSDGTGITAETLGNSLITQFESLEFEKVVCPYTDTLEKADVIVNKINQTFLDSGVRPVVFMTLVHPEISRKINLSQGRVFDLFNTFLEPLEKELSAKSSYTVGKTHGVASTQLYAHRIEAIDYAMAHDDGIKTRGYEQADIVLIGVSRCGKTPSCLYMALHFGILAANYPFTEEDLTSFRLPDALIPYRNKLFGLTIDPERLQHIRTERRPNSKYASLDQCRLEIMEVESMYLRENIPFINSTRFSIEEIATKILATAGLKRRI